MVTNASYAAAIRSLWCDRCTVFIMQNSKRLGSSFTKQTWTALFEDQPCRLSHDSVTISATAESAARMFQQTVLILDKALDIPAGSKITVTHEGVTRNYERSGVPAVFSYHQEVPIALREDWT